MHLLVLYAFLALSVQYLNLGLGEQLEFLSERVIELTAECVLF